MRAQAVGKIIIFCHQDILLAFDDRAALELRLAELPQDWGVCGVAGATENGNHVVRTSDRFGDDQKSGSFRTHVTSLDECFLVVRSQTGTRFSINISGFHLYGTDVCLITEMLGWRAYAIDFHLRHLGEGSVRQDYFDALNSFRQKWSKQLRDRNFRTTAKSIYVSGRNQPWLLQKLRSGLMRYRQNRTNRNL